MTHFSFLDSEKTVLQAAYEAGKQVNQTGLGLFEAWSNIQCVMQLKVNQKYHSIKNQVRKQYISGYHGTVK